MRSRSIITNMLFSLELYLMIQEDELNTQERLPFNNGWFWFTSSELLPHEENDLLLTRLLAISPKRPD